VRPLEAPALEQARPGGWTVRRVLHHVIESEAVYAKLLAHLCGRDAPNMDTAEPDDGADAVEKLAATRAAVLAMVDGIDEHTLYGLVRFGHEEYSPLSVLENVSAHDIDHLGQISPLLQHPERSGTASVRSAVPVRAATVDDLPRITDIYNHYVVNTPITFDLEPVTLDNRRAWFAQFSATGRNRLLVALDAGGAVAGYACSHQFRTKAAYDTTVETTVYCAPEATGTGAGSALYAALFDAIAGEDIETAVAGITLPNDASVALHERFGFRPAGVMHAVGRKFDRYWDVGWYELIVTCD
jgi:phosphinothricin acetyltransferase